MVNEGDIVRYIGKSKPLLQSFNPEDILILIKNGFVFKVVQADGNYVYIEVEFYVDKKKKKKVFCFGKKNFKVCCSIK